MLAICWLNASALMNDRQADRPEPGELAANDATPAEAGPPRPAGRAVPIEGQFIAWRRDKLPVLERGLAEFKQRVSFVFRDLQDEHDDFHMESDVEARIKDAQRIANKCARRAVADPEQILGGIGTEGGDVRYPVGDLLGARVLVRSLADVARVKRWLADHPLGDTERQNFDDMNDEPLASGYRALHVDGTVTVDKSGIEYVLPFELQVKTLAQHVFGQHTHEDAYVRDALNEDPRFEAIRNLQRAMAESLNAADLLQAEVEGLAKRIRADIANEPVGEEVNAGSVMALVRALYGEALEVGDAQVVATRARELALGSTDELRGVIEPGSEAGQATERLLRETLKRAPRPREHISELLTRRERERQRAAEAEGLTRELAAPPDAAEPEVPPDAS